MPIKRQFSVSGEVGGRSYRVREMKGVGVEVKMEVVGI